jgi:preprotein translocase subunit SecB
MSKWKAGIIGALLGTGIAGAAPLGWASVAGEGQSGTTGGAGGRTVTVTTAADLEREAKSAGPVVIKVSGTIRFDELRPVSDKTIEGAGPGATLIGTIAFVGKSDAPLKNLILRNLVIRNTDGPGDDAIGIRFAHHVNIDAQKRGEDRYEVALKVKVDSKIGEAQVFILELDYAGLFTIQNVPDQQLHPVLMIECPRLIFPFVRRIVGDVTRDGGYPPLNLEMIDFVALYRAELTRRSQATAKPVAQA